MGGRDIVVIIFVCAGLLATGCATAGAPIDTQRGAAVAELPEAAAVQAASVQAAGGWEAQVYLDREDVGVWTVKCFDLMPELAGPEVVALDDKGRCTIVYTYSGRKYVWETVEDREWLGGLWHGDIDASIAGNELYTGGKRGNLYRITWQPWGAFSSEALAHVDGEIYTILGGDFEPQRPGLELLLCAHDGSVYRVDTGPGPVRVEKVLGGAGRIRDGATFRDGDRDATVVASRDGTLGLLRFDGTAYSVRTVHTRNQGFGRVTTGPWTENGAPVFFAGCDDGSVLRVTRSHTGAFQAEPVYLGTRGVRGIAAGVFSEDPGRETVAVFGYGATVELLSRGADGRFSAQTIFTDRDKGHWLYAADLDARNSTDEIVASGYGGRVVYLSRPPGFGKDVPLSPRALDEPEP